MESVDKPDIKEALGEDKVTLEQLHIPYVDKCYRAGPGSSGQIIPVRGSIWGSGRTSQRKCHCLEERVLAQISAMKSNISVGADDAHPGVQRQLMYETAPLLRELGKCHLNHRSARAIGKGNQTLKRIQDEWLLCPPYLELEEICHKMEVVDSKINIICWGWVNVAFTEPEIQPSRGLWRRLWWPSRWPSGRGYLSCSCVHWTAHAGV